MRAFLRETYEIIWNQEKAYPLQFLLEINLNFLAKTKAGLASVWPLVWSAFAKWRKRFSIFFFLQYFLLYLFLRLVFLFTRWISVSLRRFSLFLGHKPTLNSFITISQNIVNATSLTFSLAHACVLVYYVLFFLDGN